MSDVTVGAAPTSGNAEVDTLLGPDQWLTAEGNPTDVTLTYSFPVSPDSSWWFPTYYHTETEFGAFTTFNTTQRAAIRAVLKEIESYTTLKFVETAESTIVVGDLRFSYSAASELGPGGYAAAWAYFPNIPADQYYGDLWISTSNSPTVWPEGYRHELGHALGLKHPFEPAPILDEAYDSNLYTVMSYTRPLEDLGLAPATYMVFDVLALQTLYGVNTETATGNDTYTLSPTSNNWRTIWDAGGIDTIRISNATADCSIDLNPGAASYVSGDIPTWIAFGANIENAVGTAYSDTVTGNGLGNRLDGGGGNDTLIGGAGIDTLIGGYGDDHLWVDTASDIVNDVSGYDTVHAIANYTIATGVEVLQMEGSGLIGTGNAYANRLVSREGNCSLVGLAGNDTYVIYHTTDILVETLTGGNDTVESFVSYALGNHVENLTLCEPEGEEVAYNATGNSIANVLTGNSRTNVLNGKGGRDTLKGGLGDDIYILAGIATTTGAKAPEDVVVELAGEGIDLAVVAGSGLSFSTAVTVTLAANVENLRLYDSSIGLDADADLSRWNGTGNALNNLIEGNAANNRLDGGSGNDTLIGGLGNDLLVGGYGNDDFWVDSANDVVSDVSGYDIIHATANYTIAVGVEALQMEDSGLAGTGNAYANRLISLSGNCTLTGLGGNDTYVVYTTSDTLIETLTGGIDTVQTFVDYTLADGSYIENLTLLNPDGGGSPTDATGNSLANVLTGNDQNNVLDGRSGRDTLKGGLGDDTYLLAGTVIAASAAKPEDTVIELANQGTDVVELIGTGLSFTTAVTVTLAANVENFRLYDSSVGANADFSLWNGTGNSLDNLIEGNAANNRLDGGSGSDTLIGGLGNDTLIGGYGDDHFWVNSTNDIVSDISGYDTIHTSVDYTIATGVEVLQMQIAGLSGTGNAYANRFVSLSGNCTLTGLGGNDTYVIYDTTDNLVETLTGGTDTIQSFVDYTLADGSNIENLVLGEPDGGYTALLATGNNLANIITGNSKNNVLDGRSGRDTLKGGLGDDTYLLAGTVIAASAAKPEDTVIELANQGTDVVELIGTGLSFTTAVTVTLAANVENFRLYDSSVGANADFSRWNGTGNSLDNTIEGNAANNRLDGGSGSDTLIGGLGNDTLIGGYGDDHFWVNSTNDIVSDISGNDTIHATADYTIASGVETLQMEGTGLTANGNAYANRLISLLGNCTLAGLGGNDTYVVYDTTDNLVETSTGGTDTVESFADYALAEGSNVENLTLVEDTTHAPLLATGNSLANIIIGNDQNNTLDGKGGRDTLQGGIGDDTYLLAGTVAATGAAKAPEDLVIESENAGVDVVELIGGGLNFTAAVAVTLAANVENFRLYDSSVGADNDLSLWNGIGNSLDNTVEGNAANNRIDGGAGDDTLIGGLGDDTLIGGDGADYLVGNTGDDVYVLNSLSNYREDEIVENAGEGNDSLHVNFQNATATNVWIALADNVESAYLMQSGKFTLAGNSLDNLLAGNGQDNILLGGDGNDTLAGGGGNDRLVGHIGSDVLQGGAGNDLYVASLDDRIEEAGGGGTDTLLLGIDNPLAGALQSFSDLCFWRSNGGTDLTIGFVPQGNPVAGTLTIAGMNSVASMVESLKLFDSDGYQIGGAIDLASIYNQATASAQSFTLGAVQPNGLLAVAPA